jgi:hypothetical protein
MQQHCIRTYSSDYSEGQRPLRELNDYLKNGYVVISAIPIVRQSGFSSYIEYIVEKKDGAE